jgi:hypothetical protein
MAQKTDWERWRRKYVEGDDLVTLKFLSEQAGAPSYGSIRVRASRESWEEQRKRFRNSAVTLASAVPSVQATAVQAQKIIDAAEMLTRHAQLTKLVGAIAAHELQQLRRKQLAGEPTGLKPDDALKFARAAIADERLTEGLATQRQELDLSGMSDAELESIAKGS